MKTRISPSVEDYLENIYRLEEKEGLARTKELASRMNVGLGTITNTVEMLERQRLVVHRPYRGIKLTGEGKRIALDVLRRHRLAERLLTDILEMNWSRVHDPACELEHGINEEVIKPLGRILGHPKTCPHGNPIPTRCGGIIEEKSESLVDLKPNECGTIVKITDESPDLLQHLHSLGLAVGTLVRVEKKVPYNDSVVVKLNDIECSLSGKVASAIWIRR